MRRTLLLISFVELLFTACTPVADRVFTNAKVYSINMDGQVTHAEAVAIADGKILFVGDGDGIQKYIGNESFMMTYGDGVCDVRYSPHIAKITNDEEMNVRGEFFAPGGIFGHFVFELLVCFWLYTNKNVIYLLV